MTAQQKIISFFIRHSDAFIRMASEYYAFQPHEIRKYSDQIDFRWLSRNPNCKWDFATIHQFKDQLNWSLFSRYCLAFGETKLIEEFITEIIFVDPEELNQDRGLVFNPKVLWSDQFIDRFENYLDFKKLSECMNVPWSEELIERYAARWDWVALSANKKLPWSDRFIDKYADRWVWEEICQNNYFPWNISIAKKYFSKLKNIDKDDLLDNGYLWDNDDIVEEYADFVDWQRIVENSNLPWHELNLQERWKNHIQGLSFACNRAFTHDPTFFENNLNTYLSNNHQLFLWLSYNHKLPWSIPFIERFKDYWEWDLLSTNKGLPWSMELIDMYLINWTWGINNDRTPDYDPPGFNGLINNRAIPWNIDWILKYESFIDINSLSLEPMIWEKVFKPFFDEKMLDTIFRLI